MIYSLKGIITLIQDNFLVIECSGVGYKCYCSSFTKTYLGNDYINKKEVTIYTYFSVHQDSMELFGFLNTEEINQFKLLISISGVGPKVALGVLSSFQTNELSKIISSADSKSLTSAPGIGIKTAKRIILELKDKFPSPSNELDNNENSILKTTSAKSEKKKEALNALMFLGYSKAEVIPWLSNLSENLSVEEMINHTLKYAGSFKGGTKT